MNRPRLDIRHLEMIAALARWPRVTDAAEQLGITPSALSHRLREVERRLDVPLFTRSRRRLQPTPAAEHLARTATRTLGELGRAEADVRRMALGAGHRLRLTVEDYSAYRWLPAFVHHLREYDDATRVEVVAGAARDTLGSVRDRSIDVGILARGAEGPDLHVEPLFRDELVLVMPPGHRLSGRSHVEGADLAGEDFITYSRVPAPDREYARLFRPSGSYPNWAGTVEVPEAIVELVAAGLGVSFLSAWAMEGALRDGRVVTARAGKEGIALHWIAVTRSDDTPEDARHRDAVRQLARWCRARGGLAAEA